MRFSKRNRVGFARARKSRSRGDAACGLAMSRVYIIYGLTYIRGRLYRPLIYVKPYMIYTRLMARPHAASPLDLLFRALANPTRLRLLNLIADREICVCYFVEILGISQPKISRHLAYLRRAGIVAARRQGRWMHYRLVVPRDAA